MLLYIFRFLKQLKINRFLPISLMRKILCSKYYVKNELKEELIFLKIINHLTLVLIDF